MNSRILLTMFSALLGGCAVTHTPLQLTEPEIARDFQVVALGVGQGNCVVVTCPNGNVIVNDCGVRGAVGDSVDTARKAFVTLLAPAKKVYVILSHPDGDHVNLLNDFFTAESDLTMLGKINAVFINTTLDKYTDSAFLKFKGKLASTPIEVLPEVSRRNLEPAVDLQTSKKIAHPLKCMEAPNDRVLLLANRSGQGGRNDQSAVVTYIANSLSSMVTGDAAQETIDQLESVPDIYRLATHIVAPHHGSTNETNNIAWAKKIKPSTVFFSAGLVANYGHPRCEAADIYETYSSRIYRAKNFSFFCYKAQHDPRINTIKSAQFGTTINYGGQYRALVFKTEGGKWSVLSCKENNLKSCSKDLSDISPTNIENQQELNPMTSKWEFE